MNHYCSHDVFHADDADDNHLVAPTAKSSSVRQRREHNGATCDQLNLNSNTEVPKTVRLKYIFQSSQRQDDNAENTLVPSVMLSCHDR